MALLDKIKKGRLVATKEKDAATKGTLTLLLGEVERINPKDASDADVNKAAKYMAGKIEETIVALKKRGQDVAEYEAELVVLEPYRPKLMTAEQTEEAVVAVIAEVGATTMKDMGSVMKLLPDTADKALASKLVREKLS